LRLLYPMQPLLLIIVSTAIFSCFAKTNLNILFFGVDDLRPELGCFGNDGVPGTHEPPMITPNFDSLAARSLLLKKNYVQQAVCSPTRTSLLTSRRTDRTKVFDLYSYWRNVSSNFTSIPQYFMEKGYYTVGMGKIYHPGTASGGKTKCGSDDKCHSWTNDVYYHSPNSGYWTGTSPSAHPDRYRAGCSWAAVPPSVEAKHPLPDTQIAERAIATIKNMSNQLDGDQPFFLAVGFHKPHLPFIFPESFLDMYPTSSIQLPPDQQPPKNMPPIAWSGYGELRNYFDQTKLNATGKPGTVLPSWDVLELRRAYVAAVSYTDSLLGRVMDALAASPFANNTVISLFGDHGWQIGEHGEWAKHTNFEFATHAPMMIHIPGMTDHGIKTMEYTEHVDLFPTLVEAATGETLQACPPGNESFKVLTCTEGTSLIPLVTAPNTAIKNAAFSQYPRGYVKPGEENNPDILDLLAGSPSMSNCIKPGKHCTMGYTMVTKHNEIEYRYTEWVDFNTKYVVLPDWDRLVATELYDHNADPGENNNLATDPTRETLIKKLRSILRNGPTWF